MLVPLYMMPTGYPVPTHPARKSSTVLKVIGRRGRIVGLLCASSAVCGHARGVSPSTIHALYKGFALIRDLGDRGRPGLPLVTKLASPSLARAGENAGTRAVDRPHQPPIRIGRPDPA